MRKTESRVWPVVRVASGNLLEAYDFQVFGYYAAAIGRAFFPGSNEYASLMLSFATFGAGFLMRPLGAIFLGAWIDHKGRRAGLLGTLGLMAAGTFSIACTPGFPAMFWLVSSPSFSRLLSLELWLSLMFGGYSGAMVVYYDRGHAARSPHRFVLAGIHTCNRDFRRLHASRLHIPDPRRQAANAQKIVDMVLGFQPDFAAQHELPNYP